MKSSVGSSDSEEDRGGAGERDPPLGSELDIMELAEAAV
jgi:hypothetical protein